MASQHDDVDDFGEDDGAHTSKRNNGADREDETEWRIQCHRAWELSGEPVTLTTYFKKDENLLQFEVLKLSSGQKLTALGSQKEFDELCTAQTGTDAEKTDAAIRQLFGEVAGSLTLSESSGTAASSGSILKAVADFQAVRKAFGNRTTLGRDELLKVMKAIAPTFVAEGNADKILEGASGCSGNEVQVDQFLDWIFGGLPTEVFLCRHGETDWNLDHKLQGHTDIPLNDSGREQAQAIADALKSKQLAAVWTSPLLRAKDTAAAIATSVGVPLQVDERFKERNLGIMEGRTGKELEKEHPNVWNAWNTMAEMPPESLCEPEASVIARVEAGLFDLRAANPGKSVAVVAHGAVLRCLCKQKFSNASITTLSVGPDRSWQIVNLDDVSHLKTPGLKV